MTSYLNYILFISRTTGGKPFGDNDKDKWYIFGAAGAIAFLATLAFWEMGYKEIGWKEFVHTYVTNWELIIYNRLIKIEIVVT